MSRTVLPFTIPAFGTAGVLVAGTVLALKAPAAAYGGALTIAEANTSGSGTATVTLLDMGTAGTAVAGTICVIAHAKTTFAPFAGTPAGYVLEANRWLGIANNAGTIPTGTGFMLSVTLLDGK